MMDTNAYIGIPYLDRGRGLDGVDCWGLCRLFHRNAMGNELPSYLDDYEGAEVKESVASAVFRNLKNWKVVDGEPEWGDVLVFNVMGLPIHTGIYIGAGDFLHAFKGTASCIERLNSVTWQHRLHRVIRWEKK